LSKKFHPHCLVLFGFIAGTDSSNIYAIEIARFTIDLKTKSFTSVYLCSHNSILNTNAMYFIYDSIMVFILFQTFGIVFNLSSAILGLTFLAWGNSIGGLYSLFCFFPMFYVRIMNTTGSFLYLDHPLDQQKVVLIASWS